MKRSYVSTLASNTTFYFVFTDKLIGKGGHAEVYKGRLDGRVVAVKKILKHLEKQNEDRVGDFLSELGIIAHTNHPNVSSLIGFSIDRGSHLVLEFARHGSLTNVLHGTLYPFLASYVFGRGFE